MNNHSEIVETVSLLLIKINLAWLLINSGHYGVLIYLMKPKVLSYGDTFDQICFQLWSFEGDKLIQDFEKIIQASG